MQYIVQFCACELVAFHINHQLAPGLNKIWQQSWMIIFCFRPSKFLDPDPRMRHTMWGMSMSTTILFIYVYGYNQVSIMRVLSLRSNKDLKMWVVSAAPHFSRTPMNPTKKINSRTCYGSIGQYFMNYYEAMRFYVWVGLWFNIILVFKMYSVYEVMGWINFGNFVYLQCLQLHSYRVNSGGISLRLNRFADIRSFQAVWSDKKWGNIQQRSGILCFKDIFGSQVWFILNNIAISFCVSLNL